MRGRFYCKYEGDIALGIWNRPEQGDTEVDRERRGGGWREEEWVGFVVSMEVASIEGGGGGARALPPPPCPAQPPPPPPPGGGGERV